MAASEMSVLTMQIFCTKFWFYLSAVMVCLLILFVCLFSLMLFSAQFLIFVLIELISVFCYIYLAHFIWFTLFSAQTYQLFTVNYFFGFLIINIKNIKNHRLLSEYGIMKNKKKFQFLHCRRLQMEKYWNESCFTHCNMFLKQQLLRHQKLRIFSNNCTLSSNCETSISHCIDFKFYITILMDPSFSAAQQQYN